MISRRRPSSGEVPGRPSRPLEIGAHLEGQQLGHFLLEEFIGGGGMGAVFRAQDTMLGRTVAVKVVSSESTDEEMLKRFRNEAQSAARLDHPNIARVYYVGEDKGWNYIVFEYIEGVNIRDLVEHRHFLTVSEAVSYTVQVAEALAHAAQRDVVHRDIKPSNILVMPDGRAKLVDMGLARLHQVDSPSHDLTASGVTLGTFDYISPEQARDPRSADIRSDLYSLGCTLYFMLTGMPPFPDGTVLQKLLSHSSESPPDPREVRPDLDNELATICLKLMSKQPGQRYQSPPELIADLLVLADHLGLSGITAGSTLTLAPSQGWSFWLESHVPWMAAVALFVAGGFVLEAFWSRGEPVSVQPPEPRVAAPSVADSPHDNRVPQTVPKELVPGGAAGEDLPSPDTELSAPPGRAAPRANEQPRDVAEFAAEAPPAQNGSEPDSALPRDSGAEQPPARVLAGAETEPDPPRETPPAPLPPAATIAASPPPAAAPKLVVVDSLEGVSHTDTVVNSLEEALRELSQRPELKILELRFQQRIVRRPLQLHLEPDREVTIRAAEGFQPLIAFRPSADLPDQQRMFFVNGGRVNVIGVHFHLRLPYEFGRGAWSLFDLNQVNTIAVTRCTLTLQSFFDAQAAFFSVQGPSLGEMPLGEGQMIQTTKPTIQLRSCLARGQATLIRADQGLPFWLDWEQGLFTSTEPMIEGGGLPMNSKAEMVRIMLSHVTASMREGMCRINMDERLPNLPTIVVDLHNCVLSHDGRYALIAHTGVDPHQDPEGRFDYGGKQNLYDSTQVFWSIRFTDNTITDIVWDERYRDRDWYQEQIAERDVKWVDLYGSSNRPRVDLQTAKDFLLDERQRKIHGFDESQLPAPVEVNETQAPDPRPAL